jgi:hypothetical protein
MQDYMTRFTYPFVPVEDEVLPKQMKPLLHDRPINIMKKPLLPALWEIPWLTGITSHEGLPQSLRKFQNTVLITSFQLDSDVILYTNI